MPLLLHRRNFLNAAIGTLGAAVFARGASDAVRWALLSDTHVAEDPTDTYRGFRPAEQCKTAVQQVASGTFDGYLINGDLARLAGRPGDYGRFADTAAPLIEKGPVALTLGNHDDRANARSGFARAAGENVNVAGKSVWGVDAGPLRLILLDSLLETNVVPGFLGKKQRDWLAADLDAHADRPSIVFVHHTLGDGDSDLLDADRLLKILRPRRQVKALFYGHSHQWKREVQEGLHLVNLPAVGYNFEDSEPVGWVEAEMRKGGAELTLHAFGGNRAKDGERVKLEWRA